MHRYPQPVAADWVRTAVRVALFLLLLVGGVVIIPLPFGILLWLALASAGMAWLVRWHARSFAYQCPACGEPFEISAWADFFGVNKLTRRGPMKYLRCPACGERRWARVLVKEDAGQ